jgi:cytochrome P450
MSPPLDDAVRSEADGMALDAIDVSDPQIYQDGTWYPYFARLRREDPVHYCPDSRYGPYWAVTKYKDIMQVEVNHQVYSSASELGGIQIEDQPKDMDRPSFIRMDPPRHDDQRKVVSPVVAPANLANMEGLIRERTIRVLDALPRGETFDWVDRVSIELTTMMLATLFDYPWDERRQLTYWSDVVIANVNAPEAPVHSEEKRFAELTGMAQALGVLFQERAQQPPRFDLLSMLAHGEATRNSMTGGLLALSEHPAEYQKLRDDPSLIPGMVSEIIRYVTPVIHMRRTAKEDSELGGKKIRKGDKVVIWYVSGNRDPEAIENPDAFLIDRPRPRQHLSFGFGIHRCVGNRLAEMQLRIVWEEILKRFSFVEVMGEPERIYSSFVKGYSDLPVRLHARH